MENAFRKFLFIFQVTFKALIPPLYSLDKLEKFCRKKIDRDPTAFLPRSYLANLYKNYVKYPEARKEFEILLQQGHKDDSIFKSLGEVCYRLKDYDAAIKNLEAVADRCIHDKHLNAYIGMSYAYTGLYEKAISHLTRAAELSLKRGRLSDLREGPLPGIDEGRLYESIGSCFFHLDQFERSTEWYRKALSLDLHSSRSQETRNNAANAYIQLANKLLQDGKREEAIVKFHLALDIKPEKSVVEAVSQTLTRLGEKPSVQSHLH